jgi:hypothetical protein
VCSSDLKETLKELSDIGKMEVDSEYSEDIKKSEITEEEINNLEDLKEESKTDKENNQ